MFENPIALLAGLPAPVRLLVYGTFVNKLGTFIVPFLTIVLKREFHLDERRIGALMFAYGLGSLVSILTGGFLTDRLGRRATLLISLVGSGVLAMAMGFAPTVRVFAMLLLAFGFVADLYRPASSAIIGDLLPSRSRPVGFAALRMAVNLGFAGGMVLGGLLADWNWRALFWGDGLTTLAFGLVVYASIADTRPAIHASAAPTAGSTSPWRDAVFLQILAASLAFSIAFFADFTILPLTITQSAGYPSRVYGFLIAVNGLLVGALEMSAAARLRRYRRLRVSALGVALAGMGLAATGLVMHWSWFLVAILVWTAGEILALPQQLAFVADWAPPVSRGAYLGLYGATWSLGFALNPLVFLPLHRRLPESLFWLLLGLLNVIPCWISLRLDARADHPEKLRGASREGEPPPQGVPPSDVVMEG